MKPLISLLLLFTIGCSTVPLHDELERAAVVKTYHYDVGYQKTFKLVKQGVKRCYVYSGDNGAATMDVDIDTDEKTANITMLTLRAMWERRPEMIVDITDSNGATDVVIHFEHSLAVDNIDQRMAAWMRGENGC